MINLLRFKDKQKYLVVDCETCSLNLLFDNFPWQVSYLICEGKKIKEEYDKFPFFDPLPITKGAAAVTHFNYETYKRKSESPEKVLNHLEKFLYDPSYRVIFHNGIGFDIYILNIFRKKMGKPSDYSYLDRCIDTNCLSKAMFLERKPAEGEKLINFQYKMQSIVKKGLKSSVETMCKHFQIEFDKNLAHDGIYDIRKTFEIYNKLIYQFEI